MIAGKKIDRLDYHMPHQEDKRHAVYGLIFLSFITLLPLRAGTATSMVLFLSIDYFSLQVVAFCKNLA